jgi:hypothetical protein
MATGPTSTATTAGGTSCSTARPRAPSTSRISTWASLDTTPTTCSPTVPTCGCSNSASGSTTRRSAGSRNMVRPIRMTAIPRQLAQVGRHLQRIRHRRQQATNRRESQSAKAKMRYRFGSHVTAPTDNVRILRSRRVNHPRISLEHVRPSARNMETQRFHVAAP